MPELPEVETVRMGLTPALEGRVLEKVIQRRPDLRWPLPARFAQRLTGRRVVGLGRRSKYLLIGLDDARTLIVHLGMSGRMLIESGPVGVHAHPAGRLPQHDHVEFHTDRGLRVAFNDARRFGAMDIWPSEDLQNHKWLRDLGPEPLSNAFSGATLAERLAGRAASIKAALLDQKVLAGLGNIYVCEALFRAGIAPQRRAGSISRARIEGLAAAIRATLQEAIAAGGSSLRDHRQADGALGYFQHAFRVYGREGAPCVGRGCGGTIRRATQSGRSSWWCPRCQR